MKISVDIDGVLADQVGSALKKIEEDYGQKYSKHDVNCAHWSFGGRDIWSEMTRFLIDPEFILKMPVIDGSQSAIRELAKYNIRVVSARRPETEKATKQWLNMHFPCLKEYYRASTGAKHNIPSNVLIDDLDLNIIEFVRSDPNRRGVLFWHPWSLNETEIHKYANQVYFCRDWKSVVKAILELDII